MTTAYQLPRPRHDSRRVITISVLVLVRLAFFHVAPVFANAVASGDFDGDGSIEIATGKPGVSVGGGIAAGVVEIASGSTRRILTSISPGIPDPSATSDEFGHSDAPGRIAPNEHFGQAIAVGDFNGDGFDDLAIGIPGQRVHARDEAGAVVVIYGGEEGLSDSAIQHWHQNVGWIDDYCETGDRFGSALAAGDFDHDGITDLAIGVPGEDIEAQGIHVDAGGVNVIYGTRLGLRSRRHQFWSQRWSGMENEPHLGDRFGSTLRAGEFDGQPGDDLAIGVPGEDTGRGTGRGAVSIVFGSASAGLSDARDQLWPMDSPQIEMLAMHSAKK